MKHIQRTSDRVSFKKCRQAWDWGSNQRRALSPIVTPKPLDFGTALHAGWDTYYDPDFWHVPRSVHIDAAISRFLEVTQEQKQRALAVVDSLSYEVEEDYADRVNLGVQMLRNYVQWAGPRDNFKPVKVEVEFEVPLLVPGTNVQAVCTCHSPGWPIFYQGRLDGLVQDEFNHYWILEHKTAAQFSDPSFLVLDEQCTSYAWGLYQLGILVRGVIYNEALKDFPSPPERLVRSREGRNFSVNRMQRVTYELYLDTITKAGEDVSLYGDFLDYLRERGNVYFRRTNVYRSKEEILEMGERLYFEAMDMFTSDLRIYPNPTKIGCQMCSFRAPCISKQERSDYEFILGELYTQRPAIESGSPTNGEETELDVEVFGSSKDRSV